MVATIRAVTVHLSDDDAEAALYCVLELIDRRARAGITVPQWMHNLSRRFDLASLTSEMSPGGHQTGSDSEALEPDHHVGSTEAAGLLNLSRRQVRRLAPDLGGQMIGGRLVFDRQRVLDYAKEKRNG